MDYISLLFVSFLFTSHAIANEMTGIPLIQGDEHQISLPVDPLDPSEQAIGFYSNGQLANGTDLPLETAGVLKVFRNGDAGWGTDLLVNTILDVGDDLNSSFPDGERLHVADLSTRYGGESSRHASHQNGLDVDLGYFRKDHWEADPDAESGVLPNFVVKGKVIDNFDTKRNWQIIKKFVKTKKVSRIFVDKAIKKHLCDYRSKNGFSRNETKVLRRLRPWPNHANHFHLRLKCPEGDSRCVAQNEPPEGSGCSIPANSK